MKSFIKNSLPRLNKREKEAIRMKFICEYGYKINYSLDELMILARMIMNEQLRKKNK